MRNELQTFEDGLVLWINDNYPKFKYTTQYFHIVKSCWIDECTYEETFNWICREVVEDMLND